MSTLKNNTDLDDVFKDNEANVTYVKPVNAASQLSAPSRNTKQANPKTYLDMVLEAIEKLQGRNGTSRSKITNYIVREFSIADVSTIYVTKALRSALEKNIIENTTGNGANGSFKLTKEQKDIRKKTAKGSNKLDKAVKKNKKVKLESKVDKKEKLESKVDKKEKLESKVDSDDESKTEKLKNNEKLKKKKTTSKKTLQSKDDLELSKPKKKDDKKASVLKGKENGKIIKESKVQKYNKAKKNLEKSFSTGDIKVSKETVYEFPDSDAEKKPKKLKDFAVTSRKQLKKK